MPGLIPKIKCVLWLRFNGFYTVSGVDYDYRFRGSLILDNRPPLWLSIVDCVGEPIFGCTWEGPRIEGSTSCLRSRPCTPGSVSLCGWCGWDNVWIVLWLAVNKIVMYSQSYFWCGVVWWVVIYWIIILFQLSNEDRQQIFSAHQRFDLGDGNIPK